MRVSEPVLLHVAISFHQPLSADQAALEDALLRCYLPLLAEIERATDLRVSLHFGGHLLDFLARFHEDFLFRVKTLVKRGQVEILGGPFYNANFALIPEADLRGQMQMSAEFWESHGSQVPGVMWPCEQIWAAEIPRLLEDTDLRASFIGRGQLHLRDNERAPSLGILRRGGHTITAFVLDDALSAALPAQPVDAWLSDVAAGGRKAQHQLVNVWVRAESLGLEPGTERVCIDEQYVGRLFAGLCASRAIETSLPSDALTTLRPALPLGLGKTLSAQLPEGEGMDAFADWSEFVARMPEVGHLYCRMLQTSGRLRHLIAEMEDTHREQELSNRLATAQRLVFSTQAHDVYWRGLRPGFADPLLRDAVYRRLEEAEKILDSLEKVAPKGAVVHAVRASHADLDGDLAQETYLSIENLSLLIDERRGGELLWLHDRPRGLSLLDVPSRRAEPYLESMGRARSLGAVGRLPPRRGAQPVRQAANLPNQVDALLRRGTRTWLTESDASPSAIVSGRVANLLPDALDWTVTYNAPDPREPSVHVFAATGGTRLMGQKLRQATLSRRIRLDAQTQVLSVTTRLELTAPEPLLWALEVPLRLGATPLRLRVDGIEAPHNLAIGPAGAQVTLDNEEGASLELAMVCDGAPLTLFWEPISVSVRDLSQFRAVAGGVVLVLYVLVEKVAQVTLSLTGRS